MRIWGFSRWQSVMCNQPWMIGDVNRNQWAMIIKAANEALSSGPVRFYDSGASLSCHMAYGGHCQIYQYHTRPGEHENILRWMNYHMMIQGYEITRVWWYGNIKILWWRQCLASLPPSFRFILDLKLQFSGSGSNLKSLVLWLYDDTRIWDYKGMMIWEH